MVAKNKKEIFKQGSGIFEELKRDKLSIKKRLFEINSYHPKKMDWEMDLGLYCCICDCEGKRLIEVKNWSDRYEDYNTNFYLCEDCFVSGEVLNVEKTQAKRINQLQKQEQEHKNRIRELENTIKELKQAILTFNKVVSENENF